MSVFVDSNILLRSVQPSHPLHDSAVRSLTALIAAGETLVVTPQIMAEFWNAATRPAAQNGLGMDAAEVRAELASLEQFVTVLSESLDAYNEWKHLVVTYTVTGVQVHDARLVAAMLVHGADRILTFNPGDFGRYHDRITVLDPT